jgi:hypothetical protein
MHTTQAFNRNIDQLLNSNSEAIAEKSALKGVLVQMFNDRRPPVSLGQSTGSSRSSPMPRNSLRLMTFGVVAVSKGILAKMDRVDIYSELGPSLSKLQLQGESVNEHAVGISLLFDKKVKLMQEIITQRKITRKAYPESIAFPANRNFKPSMQTIGALKRTIYASHFVQNVPLSRVDSMLNAVAHMNVSLKSSISRASRTPIDRFKLQENRYIPHSQLIKKQKSISPSPLSHPKKPIQSSQSKSELETVTGISPQSLRMLDSSSRFLQRDSGQSLQELSRELHLKR